MALYRDEVVSNAGDSGNQISASTANLDWLYVYNGSGAAAFIHVYDLAAADVTPGTTTPVATFGIANGVGEKVWIEEASSAGWTICASANADGSGGNLTGVVLTAGWG